MRPSNSMRLVAGALAALVAVACSDGTNSVSEPPRPSFEFEQPPPDEHQPSGECEAGLKFTGGGRIDPPAWGKITFGFNVHAQDFCTSGDEIKGQIQIVHHPSQSKFHSVSITRFTSYPDPERGGECADFGGTARAKHGNGPWHEHEFDVTVCDNGEPGREDRFGVTVAEDGFFVEPTDLTGGNIQAHGTGNGNGGVPL